MITDTGTQKFETKQIEFDENYAAVVPPKDSLYVPFGHYKDVEKITISSKFFPYWITGLSGNGKTLSIEQAHARNNKKLILVPITKEADEDSLLGGLRLVNGSTQPFFGPVTLGAVLGCTVCLDETDLGDEKLMCLQTPLQNRPFLIKRLGKVITPQPGFNIVATANTKGKGSDDGKFIGTNIMNEAMLDRYICLFEQDYPGIKVEKEILMKLLTHLGKTNGDDQQFIQRLLEWAEKVRKTYKDGAISEVITTRRLTHICRAYDMFDGSRKKSLELCLSRFDEATKLSFLDFYNAIDESIIKKEKEQEKVKKASAAGKDGEIPF